METTTLLFIRHGETDWNAEGRWQGHTDTPLNDTGRRQAQLLAQRLRAWPISAIYCSDLQRAAETAAILGEKIGKKPVALEAWRERHVGQFAGLTGRDIRERHPDVWARMTKGYLDVPGGESSRAVQQRVSGALETLLRQHSGETVAVVSHGGILRIVVAHVLELPLKQTVRVRVGGNTGLTVVTAYPDGRLVLEKLNDSAHLEYGLNGTDSDGER